MLSTTAIPQPHQCSSTTPASCDPLPKVMPISCDILVIEPEPDIRTIIQTSLEITTSWQVYLTHSYDEGLALIPKLTPQAIILNLPLPISCEDTLIRKCQALARQHNIFVAVMLDSVRASDYHALMELGVYGIIPKPFDCQQVTKLLLESLT